MKTANVVIGSAYGDEGKGLMTDFLSGDSDLVVRFNSGSQAGHTVQTPDGLRHIFSHFGSGTLRGVPTYLSTFFVANPILFHKEYDDLFRLGLMPTTFVSRNMMVTTPWDMMLNQFAETARGDNRHGSVGVGFGETIERCQHAQFATLYSNIIGADDQTRQLLVTIRDQWVPIRAQALGLTLTDDQIAMVNNEDILDAYMIDLWFFRAYTTLAMPHGILQRAKSIVFEGAQGLMLDQHRGQFPHVTRSNTGLTNVLSLAKTANIDHLDVHYMMRSYMTRHGAGPLFGEVGTDLNGLTCQTNVTNEWQGTMRFAPFDAPEIATFINGDMANTYSTNIKISPHITMTCCDQIDPREVGRNLGRIQMLTDIHDGHMSWGPTRSTMEKVSMRRAA